MSVRSLLLGLDVSPKRLGWGLVDLVTGEPVACGMEPIDLPNAGWHHQQVARALGEIDNHSARARNGIGASDEIQSAYIETTAKAGKYRQHDAGRAQGIVQAEVERRWPWVTVQFLEPSTWKMLAGVRAKGSVTRDDVAMVAAGVCALPGARDLKPEVYLRAIDLGFRPDGHQDAADAGCIAVAGQLRNRETWEAGEAAALTEAKGTVTEEAA